MIPPPLPQAAFPPSWAPREERRSSAKDDPRARVFNDLGHGRPSGTYFVWFTAGGWTGELPGPRRSISRAILICEPMNSLAEA